MLRVLHGDQLVVTYGLTQTVLILTQVEIIQAALGGVMELLDQEGVMEAGHVELLFLMPMEVYQAHGNGWRLMQEITLTN